MTDYQIFEAGDVALQSGLTYRKAKLAYKTYGTLNAAKSNVIVYPTSYGAQHSDTEWMIGTDKALDPVDLGPPRGRSDARTRKMPASSMTRCGNCSRIEPCIAGARRHGFESRFSAGAPSLC